MNLQELSNYGGFALGIAGVLLSIYLYYKSKEGKEPVFFYVTIQDIWKLNKKNSKIKVLYENDEVKQVFTTYLWFWNRGRRPIKKTDIPSQAPILIKLKSNTTDEKILDWRIVKISREAINFEINKIDPNTLNIDFDFLDFNDGVALEIQHSGDYSSVFVIEGVILGSPEGPQKVLAKIEGEFFGFHYQFGTYNEIRIGSYPLYKINQLIKFFMLGVVMFMMIMLVPLFSVIFIAFDIQNGDLSAWIVIGGVIYLLLATFLKVLLSLREFPFPISLNPDNPRQHH